MAARKGERKERGALASGGVRSENGNRGDKGSGREGSGSNSRSNGRDEARRKALKAAVDQITKDFGKGAIMLLGEGHRMDVETMPTGLIGLDLILGVGGLPRGRVIEVFGPESSGKTTLCLHAIAAAQREGGTAAFIDAEHALDPVYASRLGVDLKELLVSQPGCGEEALEITDALVRSGAVDMVVVDSVAALVPRAELEGEMGDSHVGLQARLMSQALRKLTATVSRSGTICIFINQLREKIGVMFGNPETTPGGRALKFYSSVRIDVRGGEWIKNGSEVSGKRMKVKVVKNKVAPPFKTAVFDVIYGEGISNESSLIELGLQHQILQARGAWIRWDEEPLGQGRDQARKFLIENPEKAARLEEILRSRLFTVEAAGPDEEALLTPAAGVSTKSRKMENGNEETKAPVNGTPNGSGVKDGTRRGGGRLREATASAAPPVPSTPSSAVSDGIGSPSRPVGKRRIPVAV
ncbi:MAG: recombinase RecA [Candidatus Hydrogenedentota bacterium]|nr:MAG: recombinase RecA [Candidatus Hydrogenedentota bacterium]